MATHAVILTNAPSSTERRLGRILEFFGIRAESLGLDQFPSSSWRDGPDRNYVLFASVDAFVEARMAPEAARAIANAAAIYLYPTADRASSERALQRVEGWATAVLGALSAGGNCSLRVSMDLGELGGPMAGITVSARPQEEDFVLTGFSSSEVPAFDALLSAGEAPVFVRFEQQGVATFLCTSAAMVDIDGPVAGAFFDVKEYFCSVVPLALFVTWAFGAAMWRPQESAACLIIDDPLLKPTYGFCDFMSLLELMNRHDFTTNVAFIPWNWRRTSPAAAAFFERERRRFSVSIHGCDHTASEFGDTSDDQLDAKARLAQSRMRGHAARTGLAHDSVMVFPQGVFSPQAPGVLKRNGFIAAVNTEVNPVDGASSRTLVRDVWDVAITRYDTFPIFTRRYAVHGLENFAFDLLIGKPCLIVTHHGFFKDGCAGLIELVQNLNALKCSLKWCSLGDVIRMACRRRVCGEGVEEIQMYGSELLVTNSSQRPLEVVVRKKENNCSLVAAVHGDRGDLEWTADGDYITFVDSILPQHQASFSVTYTEHPAKSVPIRPIRFEASVAARRLLSEFRDEYWQKYGLRGHA